MDFTGSITILHTVLFSPSSLETKADNRIIALDRGAAESFNKRLGRYNYLEI